MQKVQSVFVVDDDQTFQMITGKMIESSDLVDQYRLFSNGSEAIQYLKSYRKDPDELPDVILLDLAMPIMDGWDFLDEYMKLKNDLSKHVTIYIVTSSIDPLDFEEAKANREVSDLIVKPITKEKFNYIIQALN